MYYSDKNFIGERITGYQAPRAMLTTQAALALKGVQREIRKDNYSLVVYDAYRPYKAVEHFVKREKDVFNQKMKNFYYPYINKEEIFQLGYVSTRSAHSRGSTVDLTIIELGKTFNPDPAIIMRPLKDGAPYTLFC